MTISHAGKLQQLFHDDFPDLKEAYGYDALSFHRADLHQELFRLAGTTLRISSAYHAETDGQTEVVNRGLETYWRCFAGNTPKKWSKVLHWAEYWYKTTFQGATQMTPFKALYGRDPPPLLKWKDHGTRVQEVDELIEERNQILEELKHQLEKAQERMKFPADKHRRELEFKEGDSVYLKLKPYRFKSLARKTNEKLSPRFYGPYNITEKIGKVAYRLQLPETARIHDVFHVSQLKKALKSSAIAQPLPLGLTEDMELQVQPEFVVAARSTSEGKKQLLVHWQGLPEHEDTWEDLEDFQVQFPNFHLEDKVWLEGEGDDRPNRPKKYWGRVYERRTSKPIVEGQVWEVGQRNERGTTA